MVRDDLPGIIATRGDDFVYDTHPGSGGTCQYVWEGQPDCLFGCYLADLGVPVEAFAPFEGKSVDDLFVDGHLKEYGVTAEPEAILAMLGVQNLQDNNYSWGDSYRQIFENDRY